MEFFSQRLFGAHFQDICAIWHFVITGFGLANNHFTSITCFLKDLAPLIEVKNLLLLQVPKSFHDREIRTPCDRHGSEQ